MFSGRMISKAYGNARSYPNLKYVYCPGIFWRDSSKTQETSARTAGLEFKIRTPDLPNATKKLFLCFI
jgi:hypothetical protein